MGERDEIERIAKLEEKLSMLEKDVNDIKLMQVKASDKSEQSALDFVALTGKLSTLTDNLKTHNDWHEKQGEKKYKVTDIIIAVGMLALGIMQFYGQERQKIVYVKSDQIALNETSKEMNK